ncbi:hypothetical protein [Longimicrobium sp.]|jgi:hypothetical protein|uniref:hypothetical protein n=1 Tax=Longimicrobium sp. TaxID=2029185 RepID=UPI002EDA2CA2
MSAAGFAFLMAAIAWIAAGFWQLALLPLAQRYRTDLKPGEHFGMGRSPFWQVNVFQASNYSDGQGQEMVRRLRRLRAVQLASSVAMLIAAAKGGLSGLL